MHARPRQIAWYDWAMTIASLWVSGGIMLDGWYHFHSTVETFFEPAHAVLYAGLFASFAFTAAALVQGRRAGYAWQDALPSGYELTLVGQVIFLVGGILDLIKHSLWGFEQAFNAILSPTHLLIGAGMFLMIAGPIRASIVRPDQPRTLAGQLPMLLCAASLMEMLHWGLQFVFLSEAERMDAPILWYSTKHWSLTLLTILYTKQAIGLLAVIVQSLLLTGFFLFLAHRARLAFGAATVLFVAGNVFIAAAQSNFVGQFVSVIVASFVAGLVADAFRLTPGESPQSRWSWASFCTAASYWAVMLGMLALTMGGIWWSPDVISGSIIFAGIAGLATSALAAPATARPAA